MSSTYSYTFTRSNAEYVTSKVITDLKLMQSFCGGPSDAMIEMYRQELVELLAGAFVRYVIYGFKRDSNWVVALRYEARADGALTADDRAGMLASLVSADLTSASESSYLVFSDAWSRLSQADRAAIESRLPFIRVGAAEPGTGLGYWVSERTYSANGGGVTRSALKGI